MYIKRLISLLIILALVFPDLARAMDETSDDERLLNDGPARVLTLPPPPRELDTCNAQTSGDRVTTVHSPEDLRPNDVSIATTIVAPQEDKKTPSPVKGDSNSDLSPPRGSGSSNGSTSSLSSSPPREAPVVTVDEQSSSSSENLPSVPPSLIVSTNGASETSRDSDEEAEESEDEEKKEKASPKVTTHGDLALVAHLPREEKEEEDDEEYDEESVLPHRSRSGDSALRHEPYPPPPVVQERIVLTTRQIKQAWKGNRVQQDNVRQVIEGLQHMSPQQARYLVEALVPQIPVGPINAVNLPVLSDEEGEGSPLLGWVAINDPEQGLGGAPLRTTHLPEGWDYQPAKLKKVLAFLQYLERYTFQNRATLKQYLAMAAFAVLGGLAAWPQIPIFTVGWINIFDDRMGWEKLSINPTFVNSLVSYVFVTALVDTIPRMAWYARRAFAPSTKAFSAPRNKLKDALTLGLHLTGALPIVLIELYFLVDADEEFAENAEKWGVDPTPIKEYPYKWGAFLVFETLVWSLDQFHNFNGWFIQKFFRESVPRGITQEYVPIRHMLLKRLTALQEVIHWMPDGQLRHIYGEVFAENLLGNMQAQARDGTQSQWESMMASCRLNYLLELANQFEEDKAHVRSHAKSFYKAVTEWVSILFSVGASVARVIAMRVVFTAMILWMSFDLVSKDSAGMLGWGLSVALGLVGQGIAEIAGGVDFFHRFVPSTGLVQKTEPEGETSLRAVRYPASWYTAIESVWNLIPLVALCLDSVDEFFGGKYVWMLLFSTYIIDEYFSGAATIAESYVRCIPTNINRLWNLLRRLCGYGKTTGYMRDELALMIGRFKGIIEHADSDTLVFINKTMGQGKFGRDSPSSSTGSSPSFSEFPIVISLSPEVATSSEEEGEEEEE